MPFKFDEYRAWCTNQDASTLQREWEKYTRETSSGSAGTGVSLGLAPFTFGLSALVGLSIGGAKITNAVKKLSIVEKQLNSLGLEPRTRKRDIFGGYGIGMTVGAATHGAGSHLFDSAVHHTINHTANHVANSAVHQVVQQTPHHGSSTGDYLLKLGEKGADKLAEKGGEALEKTCYGEKVVGATWRDLFDSEASDNEETNSDRRNWDFSDSSEDEDEDDEDEEEDDDEEEQYGTRYHVEWSDSDDD